jgi:tellurite resistance protein TehA-like permease
MIEKIKNSIQQDTATNKVGVFSTFIINTILLTQISRNDTFNEIIFWFCVVLESLIILYIAAMIYYKLKEKT